MHQSHFVTTQRRNFWWGKGTGTPAWCGRAVGVPQRPAPSLSSPRCQEQRVQPWLGWTRHLPESQWAVKRQHPKPTSLPVTHPQQTGGKGSPGSRQHPPVFSPTSQQRSSDPPVQREAITPRLRYSKVVGRDLQRSSKSNCLTTSELTSSQSILFKCLLNPGQPWGIRLARKPAAVFDHPNWKKHFLERNT